MEDMKYTFETVEDDYKKIWLESTYGEGELMIIPDKTYGLMPDCLVSCDEAKKIWIPASVKIVAPRSVKEKYKAHLDKVRGIY